MQVFFSYNNYTFRVKLKMHLEHCRIARVQYDYYNLCWSHMFRMFWELMGQDANLQSIIVLLISATAIKCFNWIIFRMQMLFITEVELHWSYCGVVCNKCILKLECLLSCCNNSQSQFVQDVAMLCLYFCCCCVPLLQLQYYILYRLYYSAIAACESFERVAGHSFLRHMFGLSHHRHKE